MTQPGFPEPNAGMKARRANNVIASIVGRKRARWEREQAEQVKAEQARLREAFYARQETSSTATKKGTR